ncbi:MAG: hypothetical protein U1E16_04710 [Hyphomicrobiales bacterium]
MAERNDVFVSMIGMGYYGTVTPKVTPRNVLENLASATAHTPYQAEVSRGRLEALLNFQQMVIDMTGPRSPMPRSSMKAPPRRRRWSMAKRVVKTTANAFVDRDTHPQTIGASRPGRVPSATR